MNVAALRTIAEALRDAERRAVPIEPLAAQYAMTVDQGYRIQELAIEQRVARGEQVTGMKIGLTSAVMQRQLGVHEPDYGHLLNAMEYPDGAEIAIDRLIAPRVEGEIAFHLACDLTGPGVTAADVMGATDTVFPALEVIDSRIRDWRITQADTIADNASAAAFVLGRPGRSPVGLDLTTVGLVLKQNDVVVETGVGAAVLGNPAFAVAWLANRLAAYGQSLRSGQVVLSGSLVAAVPVHAGDVVEAALGGLGRVRCAFMAGTRP